MTVEERLDRLTATVEFVATLQRTNGEHIGQLIEQNTSVSGKMDILTQPTLQAMVAITRLARIADSHEQRLDDPESRQ